MRKTDATLSAGTGDTTVIAKKTREIQITKPNIGTAVFLIRGNAPYVSNNFDPVVIAKMRAKQAGGSVANSKRVREPKDFSAGFKGSKHISTEGWEGIPATGLRRAFISACRLVGFKMTLAKLSIFVDADGFDRDNQTPLIRFTKGESQHVEHPVINDDGSCDIRARAMYPVGWEAMVRVRFDQDQFSIDDVTNLLHRVGLQVGLGAGRPDSSNSPGMGWGTFDIALAE